MASVSGISTISKIFTKLGDNTGSVVPMYVKDVTADTLTSMTYFKEGGNRDGAEKTFEEFGTGVLWLGGIPAIKKFVFDDFIFKKKGINPDIDAKRVLSEGGAAVADTLEYAREKAASLGSAFSEQKEILQHTIENKDLAKKLTLTKFGVATAATGLALYGLITFKQKRTEKAVEKQIREKMAKQQHLKNTINDTDVASIFKGKKTNANVKEQNFKGNQAASLAQTSNSSAQKIGQVFDTAKMKNGTTNGAQPSFTGALLNIGTFFMTNPIANTTLADGVITSTRLVTARNDERWSEVGLKEACELILAYGLAAPLQKSLEVVGEKVFEKPIALDYSVLDSSVLKEAITAETTEEGASELLKQAKNLVKLVGDDKPVEKGFKGLIQKAKDAIHPSKEAIKAANKTTKDVVDFIFDEKNAQLADVFKKSGNVGTFTTKEGVEQVSLLSSIDSNSLKKTAQNTIDIIENAVKQKADPTKYLRNTKLLKGAAIFANIAISACLIGYAQPKFSLWLRKKLHNGDNTNPAIRALENDIQQRLAFEGQQKTDKKA